MSESVSVVPTGSDDAQLAMLLDAMSKAGVSAEHALELFTAAQELADAPWQHDEMYFPKRSLELEEKIYRAVSETVTIRRELLSVHEELLQVNRWNQVFFALIAAALGTLAVVEVLIYNRPHNF